MVNYSVLNKIISQTWNDYKKDISVDDETADYISGYIEMYYGYIISGMMDHTISQDKRKKYLNELIEKTDKKLIIRKHLTEYIIEMNGDLENVIINDIFKLIGNTVISTKRHL